ncbi:DUF998 domain-containing protein [Blastococcus jejuensis]|uniref:DUF998 domain-containing protein n=1 Tax=Blastococcus jejuensis TaxID=351224 RepID=UPI0031DAE3F6
MAPVIAHRLRWGALAWLLTLQFFVVETVVQVRFGGGYSRSADVISALGGSTSPAAQLMNASFVAQAALILAGAVALRPLLRGTAGRIAVGLLALAAVGVLLVGVFPLDGNVTAHRAGAVLYLVGGGLGLIALAYTLRPRSELVGTALAVLGLIGTAGTVFFLTGVTSFLGEGGTERAAAYVLPIALALAGATLWRSGADPAAATAARDERLAARARAREEKAEQDRLRDEALEAAARRHEATREQETADDDHWSTRVRPGD